ncbi:peptidoglycan-binding protein [Frankia sp. CNm7]|uniref:Peptidoglycan-binding protein n=1 Tax=Frankia nepalensis TaxID=1836974 RepID=A0A937RIG2_9ACTN|nr:peptidoglycan-binding protein [Frankia nepalensis]MBL7497336.1 peptidoglycan-binding protein [Frankia nepalensis]MBL7509707.1 peptidoglycan-binding protein [Frankia nepalensis]MBL7516945.1 peptidoglycan-binding protein [Frankia nepalensis]MBL7629434.1 peptidoglycan-binding protein [Frankia nepalensis]
MGRHRKHSVSRRRGSAFVAASVITASAGAAALAGAAPASAASSNVVSDAAIASYANNAGLSGCRGLGTATWVAIALAESAGNRNAHATVGEDSRGLWQINMRAHSSWVGSRNLYDPATNAWAAAQVCKSSGPNAWTTYTKGSYRQYMARGNAAAAAAGSTAVTTASNAVAKSVPVSNSTAWYLSRAAYHGVYLDGTRKLQQKLADLGYTIAVDGYFGPQTDSVVRAYQSTHGLLVDGVVGPKTHDSLFG